MMEVKRCNINGMMIPAFGNWDKCDELPITAYFKSFEEARQAGLVRNYKYFYDVFETITTVDDELYFNDLVRTVDHPVKSPAAYFTNYPHHRRRHRKVRKCGEAVKQQRKEPLQIQRKQAAWTPPEANEVTKQRTPRRPRWTPKAIDEDLYKIPRELLYKKPKRKGLWSGCLGINCVA